MLDKAQLSPDGKAKIKALLDLHNAIQFLSLEESEDNEERASDPPPRYIRRKSWRFLESKPVHFILLTDGVIVMSAKLLKPLS